MILMISYHHVSEKLVMYVDEKIVTMHVLVILVNVILVIERKIVNYVDKILTNVEHDPVEHDLMNYKLDVMTMSQTSTNGQT